MLAIIVACSENNAIGKDNQLLWHLPKDFAFFKKTTVGHPIIMGRKTFDSIGKALPNRRNIIVSRNADLKIVDVEVVPSLAAALALLGNADAFIIGGASIYEEALPFCNKIYMTRVHAKMNADTFFPKLDFAAWKETILERHEVDEKHAFAFSFICYERI